MQAFSLRTEQGYAAPSSKGLNLNAETMMSSMSPSSTTPEGFRSSVLRSQDRPVRHGKKSADKGSDGLLHELL
ncbi:hypothetical protein [Rhodopseudomonas sp. AAP120]|uniref:hypothetical protein n=1 Tax=Rhodopseudomonas sp. AAP120 TaxID=1523430 RepID=UPI000B16AFFD|nr:hypothetical protein [Rhodopseudomonas sp. AAP120]